MPEPSKLIITCAVTGSDTFPSQTPYLPITPDQIAEAAYKSYKAGAAIVHVHARDPKTGMPTADLKTWRQILTKIKEKCDIICCITTGGAHTMTAEQRVAVVPEFEPELCSFNTESMNFAIFPLAERIKEWKFDWEKTFIEETKADVYRNSFCDLEVFAKTFKEHDVVPECEVYSTSGIYTTRYFIRQGLLPRPVHLQFVLGVLGGTEASAYELIHLQSDAHRVFGADNYTWSVVGVGFPRQFELGALAVMLGGHVRVGLEDNIFIRRMVLAKSNSELVQEIRKIADMFGREVATVEETRKMLKLKGIDKVRF